MGKKLIEVALPLDIINEASSYDKMPGIGAHPKGIHHWWARLPLPAARAILFASLIDDPSSNPEKFPTLELQEQERNRLFDLIRRLCQKKIHTHQEVFKEAYEEILEHCDGKVPTILDPFAGGGSIPLEGMRLGLPVESSDLNPVAVLINKAMLEILPKFADQPPINPKSSQSKKLKEYKCGAGLADDLRYYGDIINEVVKNRIGTFYPKAAIGSQEFNVITWLWARTVKCPNPVCGAEMPLVRSFILSSKKKPNFFSRPIIKRESTGNSITGYEVLQGSPEIKGTVNRGGATCVCCNEPVELEYIRVEGQMGRIGQTLIGMVVDYGRSKTYISPTIEHKRTALSAIPEWKPQTKLPEKALGFRVQLYGMVEHWMLFTNRQLLGLSTIQQAIQEIRSKIIADGADDNYATALITFLMMTIDRLADYNCSLSIWKPSGDQQIHLFNRQAVPMVWDYPEANILEPKAISWTNAVDITASSVETILTSISSPQKAHQFNAEKYKFSSKEFLISTDPPYYDNIGYSDLSDFFYVWLRKGLKSHFPDLFETVLVPKMEELVASDVRYGSKEAAKEHFESGFRKAFTNFLSGMDTRFPLTVYYAFKQDEDSESENDDLSEIINLTTGWETLLEALTSAGFQITATWPIKASQKWRMVARDTNALNSYIVLACRQRSRNNLTITRREYLQNLKKEMPNAIKVLQLSNLAPVDLAQASIGPGMSIFSKYDHIIEQDGSSMRVKTALSLINNTLDEILAEQEGDFDPETRWAISWYEQFGFGEGEFGDADGLSRAKNTAVNALVDAGIVKSGGGKVKLLSREELSTDWTSKTDHRLVIWEMTQHLIKRLQSGGEEGAAGLYKELGAKAEIARELSYRLFTICEKKGWTQEAIAYNSLVLAWGQLATQSQHISGDIETQTELNLE